MTPRHTPEEREQLRALKEHPGFRVLLAGLRGDEASYLMKLMVGDWDAVQETRGRIHGLRLAMDYVETHGKEPKG